MADTGEANPSRPTLDDSALEPLIEKSPLFRNLDPPGRRRLLDGGVVKSYAPGEVIVTEGETGDSFFFIKDGRVEVTTAKGAERLTLATLSAGDVFGEVAVITAQPRTATVTAAAPSTLVMFQRRKVSRVLMDYPEVTRLLNASIEERARDTIEKIMK